MRSLLIALSLMAFAGAASADALSAKRNKFVQSCVADGENQGVCACVFERWSGTVPAAQKGLAAEMVDMMAAGRQPNMNQMMAMQPLMMSMSQQGMACAGAMPDEGNDMATAQIALPPGVMAGLHADERESINNILAGGINNLDDLNAADAKRQARIEQEAQAEEAARKEKLAKDTAARANLAASYESELAKFEASGPTSVPVGSYENLNSMYCELQGNSASTCQCRWKVVVKHAGGGSVGSAFAYLTSRSPGDDARALLGGSAFNAALAKMPAFSQDEQSCF